MIKINSILIEEFRGIRKLTLNFQGKNFAICGPNGTGKSGVVDALEFGLTGNISRLSGEGRGDISLKEHTPHVDKRADPAKARVVIEVSIPSLKKIVTIERNVKSPSTATITPNDDDVIKAIRRIGEHPEIMLSRRELIRYVLATPGKRNEEVQALLHLDEIGQVRASLLKIANSLKRESGPMESAVKVALENLNRALGIGELSKDAILAAANPQRALLNLPAIAEFTATTSLKDGIAAPVSSKAQAIPKRQALSDIQAAFDGLEELEKAQKDPKTLEALAELQALATDPTSKLNASRESFYKLGISLIEAETCPFCEDKWDPAALRAKVQTKLDQFKEFSRKQKLTEKKLVSIINVLQKTQGLLDPLLRYAATTKPALELESVKGFLLHCRSSDQKLTRLHTLADGIEALERFGNVPKAVSDEINQLRTRVSALPEATKQDSAREFLTIAQERLEVWREAKRKELATKKKFNRARQLLEIYAK